MLIKGVRLEAVRRRVEVVAADAADEALGLKGHKVSLLTVCRCTICSRQWERRPRLALQSIERTTLKRTSMSSLTCSC